jgi:PspA-Associated protein
MIVRILGEGQLEVEESATEELNVLDAALDKAVTDGNEPEFRRALAALLDRVRVLGTPLATDTLEPSDLIVPHADADLAAVRSLLTEDGYIPG